MSAAADGRRGGASRSRPAAPGGVHEETARLFEALEGAAAAWAHGERPGRRPDGAPGDDGAGHLPTTCGVCPLCLALDRLGRQHPEVLAHLGDAVQALGAAVAALTAEPPAADPDVDPDVDPPSRERARTERIDVTD